MKKTLYLAFVIYIVLTLSSCTTLSSPQSQPKQKDPLAVAIYQQSTSLKTPHSIVGDCTISHFHPTGTKRQEAIVMDQMRNQAAAMGGDAIINIRHQGKTVVGTVVEYDVV